MKEKIYIFDFDNTLVNTAHLIYLKGYNYDFHDLCFYPKISNILISRVLRSRRCIILSKRNKRYIPLIARHLKNHHPSLANLQIITVSKHFLKILFIWIYSIKYRVVFLDDMFKNEENGKPLKLKFPHSLIPKSTLGIFHEELIKIRSDH